MNLVNDDRALTIFLYHAKLYHRTHVVREPGADRNARARDVRSVSILGSSQAVNSGRRRCASKTISP